MRPRALHIITIQVLAALLFLLRDAPAAEDRAGDTAADAADVLRLEHESAFGMSFAEQERAPS